MEWIIFALIALSSLCFLGYLLVRPVSPTKGDRPSQPVAVASSAQPLPPPPPPPAHPRLPYIRHPALLTPAERAFFVVLCAATPEEWIAYPQVRLANLIDVAPHARRNYRHFNRVAAKCVDFVLCERVTSVPRLVVELDDSSHNRPDRQARDAFVDAALANAGLPILHVRWQPTYKIDDLAARIQAAAGLPLPTEQTFRLESPSHTSERSIRAWACRSCGAEVSQEAGYCPSCGATLRLV